MDNNSLIMTCEQAEDELSGYLDGVLDPPLRQTVEAHLATCDQCRVILEDFRRGDEMLRALPFIEPPAGMRERFFESPRYQKLTQTHPRRFSITPLAGTLAAAAMVALALGGALFFWQGVLANQQASKSPTTSTIGNPTIVPLAAGPRLIYPRGSALWSAPENGAGLPRQLTPNGITVAGWSVSPNGRMVIYIDARTGALHSIRADGLNDATIGSVTAGKTPLATFWATAEGSSIANGIAWSADNTRLAYLAQGADGVALHVMNQTGSADVVARPGDGSAVGRPLWSSDSVYVAYTVGEPGAQSVSVFNVTTGHALVVAQHSDASDPAAVVGRLSWVRKGISETVTWFAQAPGGEVTGIFRADANTGDSATRLTPPSARYAAADISGAGNWLLAQGATLSAIPSDAVAPHLVATFAGPITRVRTAPSPSGQLAAVIAGGTLSVLMPDGAVVTVAHDLSAQSVVVWALDGSALAWQSGGAVTVVQVRGDSVSAAKMIAEGDAVALSWSLDDTVLAVRSSAGISVVAIDGLQVRASDAHAAPDGKVAWSYAG